MKPGGEKGYNEKINFYIYVPLLSKFFLFELMRPFHLVNCIAIVAVVLVAADTGLNGTTKALTLAVLVMGYVTALFIGALWPGASFYLPIITRVKTAEKIVALTFDDGPDKEVTPLILDALQAAKAKATFFWVGEAAEKQPEIGRRAVAEGHLLANHTYRHSYTWNFKTSTAMHHEIVKTNRILDNYGGPPIRFFRPPVGMTRPGIDKVLQSLTMQPVAWSRKAGEGRSNSVENIVRRLTTGVKNGEILLLHETYYNKLKFPPEQIISVLNGVIKELKQQGFGFVCLDTLLEQGVHPFAIDEDAKPVHTYFQDSFPVYEKIWNHRCSSLTAGQLHMKRVEFHPDRLKQAVHSSRMDSL